MLSAYVCLESNLVNVPLDSWWLDSGVTVHVATSLQGIRNLRKPSEKESKLKVGSDIRVDVEHIGICFRIRLWFSACFRQCFLCLRLEGI